MKLTELFELYQDGLCIADSVPWHHSHKDTRVTWWDDSIEVVFDAGENGRGIHEFRDDMDAKELHGGLYPQMKSRYSVRISGEDFQKFKLHFEAWKVGADIAPSELPVKKTSRRL